MSSPTQELTDNEVEEYLKTALSQGLIDLELQLPGDYQDDDSSAALPQDWVRPESQARPEFHNSFYSRPPSESLGRGFGHPAENHLYISPSIYYNPPEANLQDPKFHIQHPLAATTEEAANNMNHHQSSTLLHVRIHSPSRNQRPRRTATTPARIASNNNYELSGSPRPPSRRTVPRAYRPATQYRESGVSPRPLSRRTTVAPYRSADPRPPHAFFALDGYWGIRNDHHLLDCFEDCNRKRLAERGVGRRANMLAHLRHYHGQDIQRGG